MFKLRVCAKFAGSGPDTEAGRLQVIVNLGTALVM